MHNKYITVIQRDNCIHVFNCTLHSPLWKPVMVEWTRSAQDGREDRQHRRWTHSKGTNLPCQLLRVPEWQPISPVPTLSASVSPFLPYKEWNQHKKKRERGSGKNGDFTIWFFFLNEWSLYTVFFLTSWLKFLLKAHTVTSAAHVHIYTHKTK